MTKTAPILHGWQRRKGPLALAFALVLVLPLAACSTLGGGVQQEIYDLPVPTAFDGIEGRTGAQLLVPVPAALNALATERVVVRPSPAQIAYYPQAVWTDQLPALVQTKLIQAFENSGRAKAVGRPGDSLAIDYQVIIDVRAFEFDVAGGRTGHVALGVKLLDDRTGKVRATKVFEVRQPAPSDSPDDAVAAIGAAAGTVLTEIVLWTAGTI